MKDFQLTKSFKHKGHHRGTVNVEKTGENQTADSRMSEKERERRQRESVSESSTLDSTYRSPPSTHHHNFHRLLLRSDL